MTLHGQLFLWQGFLNSTATFQKFKYIEL